MKKRLSYKQQSDKIRMDNLKSYIRALINNNLITTSDISYIEDVIGDESPENKLIIELVMRLNEAGVDYFEGDLDGS